MHGRYKTQLRFRVRKVSLRQLAGLWSTVMGYVPDVRSSTATFERRGQFTEHTYHFDDADELAHADLDVKPDGLRLSDIFIDGPNTRVRIDERWRIEPLSYLLVQPSWLLVDISGSNERDVVRLRTAIEQWGERNLDTRGFALWLKGGVLVAGLGAASVLALVMDLPASEAHRPALLWFAAFKGVECLQMAVPALRRRTLEVQIVNRARPGAGGRGGQVPAQSEPGIGARAGVDIDARAAREDA